MGEIENVIFKANTKAFAPSKDAQKHLTKEKIVRFELPKHKI